MFGLVLWCLTGAGCDSAPEGAAGGEVAEAEIVRLHDAGNASELIDLANQGNVDAADAVLLLAGRPESSLDGRSLAADFIAAAERRNGPRERLFIARQRLTGRWVERDADKARASLTKLADEGVAEADVYLGMLASFSSTSDEDTARAVTHLRRAAQNDEAFGQFLLAAHLEKGDGVPADPGEAAEWYRKSADAGILQAQHNLGLLHLEGRGVPASPFRAQRWLRKAADQGYPPSCHRLGRMLVEGIGVKKDPEAGFAQLRAAADAGHIPALLYLGDESQRQQLHFDAWRRYQTASEAGSDLAKLRMAKVLQSVALELPGGRRGSKFDSIITNAGKHMGVGTYREAMDLAGELIASVSDSDQAGISGLARRMETGHRNLQRNRDRLGVAVREHEAATAGEVFLGTVVAVYAIKVALDAALPDSVKEHWGQSTSSGYDPYNSRQSEILNRCARDLAGTWD